MTPTALSIIATTSRRRRGAEQGARDSGRARRHRRHRGVADRRTARRRPRLGMDLLHQHPLGLAALALAPLLLRESRAPTARRSWADPAGALYQHRCARPARLRAVEAPDARLGDPRTILLVAGSAVLLAAFVFTESRYRAPLVPLRLLRSRTLVGANLVMLLTGAVAVGMPFVLTLYGQQVLGYSAVKFGLGSVSCFVACFRRRDRRSSCCPQSRLPDGRRDRHGAHGRGVAPAHTGLRKRQLLLETSSSGCSSSVPGSASCPPRSRRFAGVAEHESGLSPQQHRPPDRRRTRCRDPHDCCRSLAPMTTWRQTKMRIRSSC